MLQFSGTHSHSNRKTMQDLKLQKLKYPVGKFIVPENYTDAIRQNNILSLKTLPARLSEVVNDLSDVQLDLPYRKDGWCSRQIIHHLADSHMNSFIRFKLAMTEDNPRIKAYSQDAWAKGTDAKLPIDASIKILEGVHQRLVNVMENMSTEDFQRTLFHPEWNKNLTLDFMGALYGWHSEHHLTQIIELKKRQGWS